MKLKKLFSLIAVFVITMGFTLNSPTGTQQQATSNKQQATSTKNKPIILSDANFAHEIKHGVVLVDFWATWCGPCRRQGPIVEELAREFAGKVKVCKLDVDHNKEVSAKYYIRSIPTIIIFKDGKVMERLVGLRTKSELEKTLKIYL